jgi:hypothetical protein
MATTAYSDRRAERVYAACSISIAAHMVCTRCSIPMPRIRTKAEAPVAEIPIEVNGRVVISIIEMNRVSDTVELESSMHIAGIGNSNRIAR